MKRILIALLCFLQAVPVLAIERNVASQKLVIFAFDYSTGAPKTGDAANLTAYAAIDGDTTPDALTDTSATELSSTNAPGWYQFDLSQGETNGVNILYSGKSATANVVVRGFVAATTAPNASLQTIATAGGVKLGDVAHGGTAATLALKGVQITATDTNANAVGISGNGNGAGLIIGGGATGPAVWLSSVSSAAAFYVENGTGGPALRLNDGSIDLTVEEVLDSVKTKTDFLPSATAGAAGGVFIAGSNAATTVNITGNLSGSVGSIATGGIAAASFAAGAIDASAIAANAIGASEIADSALDAGAIAADAITAAKLHSDVTTELQTGLATAAALSTVGTNVTTIDTYLQTNLGANGSNLTNTPIPGDTWNSGVVATRILTHLDEDTTTIDLNATTVGSVTDLAAKFIGMTSLPQWLGAIAGKQTPNSTALTEINATGAGSGTYSAITDALEANRDNIGTAGAGLTAVSGGGGDGFTDTERAQIMAALSLTADTGVPRALTFVIERVDGQLRARSSVPLGTEETAEILFDFRSVLADNDAIASITAIELIAGGDDVVDSDAFDDVDNAELWMNAGVKLSVTSAATDGEDRIRVRVLTTGGNTLSVPGTVTVRGE